MGYQVGVTPLQMVTAVSSVANGGRLMEPRAVRALYQDNRRFGVSPRVLQQTITPETAAVLTGIMEQVVERGTARGAKVPGYAIAGKTGTASKLINGRYSASENNVSFVGFLPSRKPVAAIIVVIDGPRAGGNSGGAVSAPVFKRIAEATLRYLGVPPTVDPAPPVMVARRTLKEAVPTSAPVSGPVVDVVRAAGPGEVPDLRGLSARDATRALVKLGLRPRVTGNGVVVSQEPAPGSPTASGGTARLVLDRQGPPVVPVPGVAQP
jgi:cell division protein FtsI (penicillin-binding protein 3)